MIPANSANDQAFGPPRSGSRELTGAARPVHPGMGIPVLIRIPQLNLPSPAAPAPTAFAPAGPTPFEPAPVETVPGEGVPVETVPANPHPPAEENSGQHLVGNTGGAEEETAVEAVVETPEPEAAKSSQDESRVQVAKPDQDRSVDRGVPSSVALAILACTVAGLLFLLFRPNAKPNDDLTEPPSWETVDIRAGTPSEIPIAEHTEDRQAQTFTNGEAESSADTHQDATASVAKQPAVETTPDDLATAGPKFPNSSAGNSDRHHPDSTAPASYPYPATKAPDAIVLEAKRPDQAGKDRPIVEFEGTILNPDFRAEHERNRSRIH